MYRIDQEKLIRSFSRSILSGSIEFTLSTRNLKGRLAGSGVSLTILGNYRCIRHAIIGWKLRPKSIGQCDDEQSDDSEDEA